MAYEDPQIPPESFEIFKCSVSGKDNLQELQDLILEAECEKRYIIHFGV